jgi:protoheme ferro-lyase
MGWRAIFGVLLGSVALVAYLVWKWMPETRSSQAPPPRPREMLAAATTLLRMPLFAACVVQSGVVYATFLVFISLTPYVMVSALGRSPTEFGMYYVLIALGYFFGSWSVGRWMTSREQHWMIRRGIVLQLAGAATALILFAVGLGHPLTLFVPLAVLTYGQGLSLPNVTATSVSLVPEQAGVASSVLGFLQQVIGAVSVQWMGIFPTDTALPMLIFCTAGLRGRYGRVAAAAAFRRHTASRAGAAEFRSGATMSYAGNPDHDHGTAPRLGVLLVNLGTPDAPTVPAVRRYLAEFLSDPAHHRGPALVRWLVLHGVILRFRPRLSAHAYRQIWTPAGSPLLVHSTALAAGLRTALTTATADRTELELAMTYGQPAIAHALERLRGRNVRRLLVLPLYPQYSATTTGAIFDRVTDELSRWRWVPEFRFATHYYDEVAYLAAVADSIARHWQCTAASTCCFRFTRYRSGTSLPAIRIHCHCHATARGVAERSISTQRLDRELPVTFWPRAVAAALHRGDAGAAGTRGRASRQRGLPGLRR